MMCLDLMVRPFELRVTSVLQDYLTKIAGVKRKCAELGITLLGDIPLHPQICSDADAGKPTVVGSPNSPQAEAFIKLAKDLKATLGL
jgi:MinD superfamily P-loop ATPase